MQLNVSVAVHFFFKSVRVSCLNIFLSTGGNKQIFGRWVKGWGGGGGGGGGGGARGYGGHTT